MIKRNIKMAVTPEESQQVQEICFANGIFWTFKGNECTYTDRKFLYIDDRLTWGSLELSFKEDSKEEVDAKFFIRTNGSCIEENQEFKVGDIVGVYCPHPLCGYTNVKVVGVEVNNYILEAVKDSTGHIPYQLRNKNFFVAKDKVFVTGYEQQFLLNKDIKEEQMRDNEVETYKDVKEYLVAKGLYEEVLSFDIDFEGYSHYFGNMFWFDKTPQGFEFWVKIEKELVKLEINDKLDEILEDYKVRKLERTLEEIVEQTSEQPTEAKPKQYLVFVPTKGKPKYMHQSLESAQEEAKRLCKSELCEVMVLEVVSKYQAKVIVEEI